jgi:hypothetical protein
LAFDHAGLRAEQYFTHTASWQDEFVTDMYLTYLSREESSTLLVCLCECFELGELSSVSRVEADEIPAYSLEGGKPLSNEELTGKGYNMMLPFGSRYSIGPDNLQFPVLNVGEGAIEEIIIHMVRLRDSLQYSFIERSNLAWKGRGPAVSARTSGNRFRIEMSPKKCDLVIGVEQYSDGDPPTRQFWPLLRDALSQIGLT